MKKQDLDEKTANCVTITKGQRIEAEKIAFKIIGKESLSSIVAFWITKYSNTDTDDAYDKGFKDAKARYK